MTVLGKEEIDGFAIQLARRVIVAKIGNEVAALLEILVARRALLPVPARLVDHDGGRQDRQLLDGKGEVRQIGDAAMAVLKIKRVEELLGLLFVELGQRLAQRKRGPRILRHAIGQHFGIGSMNRINIGRGVGIRAGFRWRRRQSSCRSALC